VGSEKANLLLWGFNLEQTLSDVAIEHCSFDEANDKPSLLIKDFVNDTRITDCDILYGNSARGIHIAGSEAKRTIITNTRVKPFGANVPDQTIEIDAGVEDTTLLNVSTDPAGGGDILDNGTNTVFINVNQSGVIV
jgi:hypothetical protein